MITKIMIDAPCDTPRHKITESGPEPLSHGHGHGWWVAAIKSRQLSGHKRYSHFGGPHPIMYQPSS
jgi:hypothetical protein